VKTSAPLALAIATALLPQIARAAPPPTAVMREGRRGLRAVRFVHRGEVFVVVSYPTELDVGTDDLTPAEADIARMVVRGMTNNEIAEARGRSANTVANQLKAIFRKLHVSSRIELVRRARDDHGGRG
jgi:DNA-binding NarL/FixJ family response regulator